MKQNLATLNKDYTKAVSIKHLMVLGCLFVMTGMVWGQDPAMSWMQVYGGSADEAFHAVECVEGYGYIGAGYTESSGSGGKDAYLVMTDLNGNIRWEKTYGGSLDDVANAIIVAANCYIFVGYTESMGYGGKDIYIVCVDKEGVVLWKQNYGSSADEEALAIVQDQDGGCLITGYTGSFDRNIVLLKTDAYGNRLWYNNYLLVGDDVGYDVIETADDGYMVAGSSDLLCGNQDDAIILKTDNSGAVSWIKRFGEKGIDVFRSVRQSSDNGYVLTGYTDSNNENFDVYVVRLSENGDLLWTETYGSTADEYGYAVQGQNANGYIICGYQENHGTDCYLINIDDSGSMIWEKVLKLRGNDIGYALRNTGSDKYLLAGSTDNNATGNDNAFLILLCSEIGEDFVTTKATEPMLSLTINPAQVRTMIKLELEKNSKVDIEIFNIMGQKVLNLGPRTLDKGVHKVVWNLHDKNGYQVASGVYLVRLVIDGQEFSERLVVMH